MKPIEDAHGQVMLKYFKGLPSLEVVERIDGYVNVDEGAEQYFSEYKDWKSHEREAIKYAHGRCLDIGCGAGRVPLYLQKKGISCLGIDYSPLAIKICKLRGVKSAKRMAIEDLPKFKSRSFDTVIMFGNNFGLFGNKKKAKQLLKELHRITPKNGVIMAESRDPYMTDNPVHFKYHKANVKQGRMPGQLRMKIRFMQYSTPWYDYLYVSEKEMTEILKDTGWKIKKEFKSRDFKRNGLYIAIITKE